MVVTELCIVAGELRFWRDVKENGKDEFVWEFENCEMEMVTKRLDLKIDARARTKAGLRRWRS